MTKYPREEAILLVVSGAIVTFFGIAMVSLPSAFIVLAGVVLIFLGAFIIEVPEP